MLLTVILVTGLETALRQHRLLRTDLVHLPEPVSVGHEEVPLEMVLTEASVVILQVIWEACELILIHLLLELFHDLLCFVSRNLLAGTLDAVKPQSTFPKSCVLPYSGTTFVFGQLFPLSSK